MTKVVLIFVLLIGIGPAAWGDSALKQLSSKEPFAITKNNQLTILAYPAGRRLDWTTPGALIRSVVWNTIMRDEHPLSHMDVFLRCESEDPVLAGMSRVKTWKTQADVLFRGQSLNLLMSRFPGYLIQKEKIIEYLRPAIEKGRVRAVSFDLSKNNCARLRGYYLEYLKRKYDAHYSGFNSNVYAGEGAGCAAYGVSFVHVAGLLDTYLKEKWSRYLSVPDRLLSPALKPPSAWSYIFGRDESWAQKEEPALHLHLYDPEKIFDWVGEEVDTRHTSLFAAKVIHVEKASELIIDGTKAAPEDDYWNYKWPQP